MLISEDFQEGIASALGPVRIMIALNHIIWEFQSIHHALGQCDFLVGSEIGNVTSEKDEIKGVIPVHILQTGCKVFYRTSILSEVSISQKSESQRTVSRFPRIRKCPRHAQKHNSGHCKE